MREEVFRILEDSDILERFGDADFENEIYGVFVVMSVFKDVGWVNYVTKVIDRDIIEERISEGLRKVGVDPLLVRSTGALDVVTVGRLCEKNDVESVLDGVEEVVSELVLSKEFLGTIRRFAEIFSNPFKDTFELSVGFSRLKSPTKRDLESAVRIAVRDMELRRVDRITRLSLELIRILESGDLESYFQPMVDLEEKKVFAYEALARGPEGSLLRNPYLLFKIATLNGLELQLDSLLLKNHLRRFSDLGFRDKIVSINIASSTPAMIDEIMRDVSELGIPRENVMWEISEKTAVDDYNAFGRFIDLLVREGFKVAVDDFGSSAMTFKFAWAIENNVIKLDKKVVDEMLESDESLELMERTLKCFYKGDNLIVAEGVEKKSDLKVMFDLGYSVVQGYVLARPSPEPPTDSEIRSKIEEVLN